MAAYRLRRTRDFLLSATSLLSLLAALLAGRVREVWVGDSHTVCFNRSFVTANVLRGGRGVYVFHIGSRLMFSVARQGEYPRWTRRLVTLTARLARRPIPMFFCLGEIDVRCHLAKHGGPGSWDFGFVQSYVSLAVEFARSHGFAPIGFVAPPPPCLDHLSIGALPVVGDFQTRTAAFDGLRAALAAAVAESDGNVRFIDATDVINDPVTGIRADLTDDQCHVNAAGRRLVRDVVDHAFAPAGR